MNRNPPKRKSALAKLKQIDGLVRKINEQIAGLENAPHLRRSEPLTRGKVRTVFDECDDTCPTCRREKMYYRRRFQLREPQQAALIEIAQSRFASDQALARSREKVTLKAYLIATEGARTKKEVASLLGVTGEGLRRWEIRNHIKWTKNKGLFHIP